MRSLLLVAALSVAALSQADNLRAIAEQNTAAQRKATLTKNLSWFEKTQAKDYYEIDLQGKRTSRAEALESTKEMFARLKLKTLDCKVLTAKASGKDLSDTVEIIGKGEITGPDGKPHILILKAQYKELWSKIGGAWKIRSQESLSESSSIDGHPLP